MIALKRPKALVLDDEPPFEKLLAMTMIQLGWSSMVGASQEEALARLKTEPFDVLIIDYHMSQGNGLHFICCLRQHKITLPAIVMSGDIQAIRLIPKDLLNVPATLPKPFTVSELQAALAEIPSLSRDDGVHGATVPLTPLRTGADRRYMRRTIRQ